jgi:hypothetical protein
MEEVFRFLLARPAQKVAVDDQSVPVRPSDEYHGLLTRARAAAHPRSALKETVMTQLKGGKLIRSLDELKHGRTLPELLRQLRADEKDRTLDELEQAIGDSLGASSAAISGDDSFMSDWRRVSDAVVTNSILGREVTIAAEDGADILRGLAFIKRVADRDERLASAAGRGAALSALLLLPDDVFPVPREPAEPDGNKQPGEGETVELGRLRQQRELLYSTYSALTRVSPEQIDVPAAEEALAAGGRDEARREAGLGLPPVPAAVEHGRAVAVERAAGATREVHRTEFVAPAAEAMGPILLRGQVAEKFAPEERRVLAERELDLTRVSLPVAVERLSLELQSVEMQLMSKEGSLPTRIARLGQSYVPITGVVAGAGGFAPAGPPAVPSSHGTIAPVGIGDLLVVRQSLKRYEARELSYIENVLKGEYKERVHRRARTTEETITTEDETKREEERDQQTTERFELKRESSQVVKDDMSLKIGLAVSGKYGPVVEFKASTDFALNHSQEEAQKVATSYSKDVTSRATSRIFERHLEQRILKTIEVFEETNTHGVDNKGGTGPVIGQYQWVDKVYEAQVFNYGKRLLFDLMLPEPAAFMIYALANAPTPGADLVKPAPFTLSPSDVSEWNYSYYVKLYEVVGVTPPPQPYVTVGKVIEGQTDQDSSSTKTLEIPIPDGYQALSGNVVDDFTMWDDAATIDYLVAKGAHRFSKGSSWFWSFSMSNEVGTVPVAIVSWRGHVFAGAIEVNCQRTQRALDDWKLKTHAAILQAYQKLARDYEEKLAALQVQAAQQFQGRNPTENESIIRTELKKGALSVFTDQQFDLFGAISSSSQGYPQPDLPEAAAEGKYIRFFEEAFEWEQMMYFFYPYFWGRKANWRNRALLEDTDPAFADFARAGAARVVISVRPGFEQAVAHFLDTGEIWDGADLPPITSPLYVSIIQEIRERDQAPGDEVPQGDPWNVRLPTTLVRLRPEESLPSWHKNAQGEWVPD